MDDSTRAKYILVDPTYFYDGWEGERYRTHLKLDIMLYTCYQTYKPHQHERVYIANSRTSSC